MEEHPVLRHVYTAFLAAWALSFAVEAAGIGSWAWAISTSRDQIADRAAALETRARELSVLTKDIQAQGADLEFLQNLPNILPKDKGYLRTQKAVSDEVQALRRKLGPRLKGVLYIVIDAKANKLYVKKGLQLLWEADCSVGRGGLLVDKRTGRRWEFVTPRGEFKVIGKGENPVWRKPDWAYVETKEPAPPPDDPARLVQGELGAFVLNLGDGYLIHGTKNEETLGRPASHGCVRLGADDLKKLYAEIPLGTRVFIFY
jgi:L,D-transpeptidase YbiS